MGARGSKAPAPSPMAGARSAEGKAGEVQGCKPRNRLDMPDGICRTGPQHHCETVETGNESWRFRQHSKG